MLAANGNRTTLRSDTSGRNTGGIGRVGKQRQAKSSHKSFRVRGRQYYHRGYGDIPRQDALVDEALENLAIQQANTGFFYIIELTAPNQVGADLTVPRYDAGESQQRGSDNGTITQQSYSTRCKRQVRTLKPSNRMSLIQESSEVFLDTLP